MGTLTGLLIVTAAVPLAASNPGTAFGALIALGVGVWVALDAQKNGMRMPVLWGIGVFLFLIVFLPAYLIVRYRHVHPKPPAAPPAAPA